MYKYVIESSDDDKSWKRIVDRSTNGRPEEIVDEICGKARYFRLTVLGVDLPGEGMPGRR